MPSVRRVAEDYPYQDVRQILRAKLWTASPISPAYTPSWKLYEDFVRDRFKAEEQSVPDGYYLEYLVEQKYTIFQQEDDADAFQMRCYQFSRVVAIFSGTLYAISRAALIVVAFTSLRSVPEELYVTSWTRFMPNVS
jgi:hypothetical protein